MKESIINKMKNDDKILRIIMAIFVYLLFHINGIIVPYNPISWSLLVLLVMFYLRVDIYNKKYIKSSLIFSIVFSLLMFIGGVTYNVIAESIITMLISFVGIYIVFYTIIINLLPKLCEVDCLSNSKNNKYLKLFVISFIVIFISWIPYFLSLYPAVITDDSTGSIETVFYNFSQLSNHHPIIYAFTIAIPFKLGYLIFRNSNAAIACYAIVQMIIMASIFSYLVVFLAKKNIKKIYLVLCILYFSLIPMHGYFSVTIWKDIIFAGLIVLFTIKIIKICDKYEVLKFRDLISFIIISLLVILYRNNAIYMYFIFSIFMLIFLKDKIKIVFLSLIIVLSSYYMIVGPIFSYYHVANSSSAEYIAIPLQQVGRMAYENVKFTKNEKKILDKLIGVEKLKIIYNPITVDDIKFNESYNRDYFNAHKTELFLLWVKLTIQHPVIATKAYLVQTLGYWYPGVNYWSVHKGVAINSIGLRSTPKGPKVLDRYASRIEDRTFPFVNMTWSTSLAYWILGLFGYVCIRKKVKRYILAYVPVFGVWLTLMVATPVFAEFRYIYSVYTCLPLLMLLPYFKDKKIKNK
ncbi:MAG: hypothetical protein E7160_04010 [Firmicutes bacterium]|nr:hypothetical protein [Bacillota bacterium]